MINRIGQLGPALPNFANLTAWPTPAEILRAGPSYLTNVCRLGYRADSILKFCDDVAEGRFDPQSLDALAASPDVTSDELLRRLYSIRGIGPGTATWLLSFLGRHDRLTIDSSTLAHVARVHTNGRKPTFKQIEKIYAPYGKWKNMVWWYEHWLTWDTARAIVHEAGARPRPSKRGAAP
jgi:3-methyladenine DNA glycosylase/8-oxoguanine DNA glycosylase